jgi:hypothetical protein
LGAKLGAGVGLQRSRGTYHQIFVVWHPKHVGFTHNFAITTHIHIDAVSQTDQPENCLQQVIAVFTSPNDMQKQIQFCWCRKVVQHG